MKDIRQIRKLILEAISHLEKRFLEREELIRLLFLGAMGAENILLVGPPGTAKSQLARAFAEVFGTGGWFDYLLTRFTTPDEMFGPVSLQALKQDRYIRQTEGYLPRASFAFLDEIFKANSAILNSLLSILNERVFFNGRVKEPSPLLFLVAATNELPDDSELLDALYDRFLIRYEVGFLQQISSYELMFQAPTRPVPALLSLNDIETVRSAADDVTIGEAYIFMLFQLKTALEEKEFRISDRRWKKIGSIWKTSAALNGRTSVDLLDTVFTPHMLWDEPEDLVEVRALFDGVFRSVLRKEMENELPLQLSARIVAKWEAHEEELHSFQFKKEMGARLGHDATVRLRDLLEECGSELEETARNLRGKLIQWQQRESRLQDELLESNFLLLDAGKIAVQMIGLRIEGEKQLQALQKLYRTLFDRDIPGASYDYTL